MTLAGARASSHLVTRFRCLSYPSLAECGLAIPSTRLSHWQKAFAKPQACADCCAVRLSQTHTAWISSQISGECAARPSAGEVACTFYLRVQHGGSIMPESAQLGVACLRSQIHSESTLCHEVSCVCQANFFSAHVACHSIGQNGSQICMQRPIPM